MKNFELRIFLISAAVAAILSFVSFYAAFSETIEAPSNSVESWPAKAIYVFGFPLITLTSRFDFEPGASIFFLLLVINCLLYGLMSERLIFFIKKKTKLASAPVGRK